MSCTRFYFYQRDIQKNFCSEIAYNILNTDYTATRMLGYLYRYTEPRIEDVIDEMIAIFKVTGKNS